mmetsp:Transcript_77524/g.149803  ORF Transcript_77524/g.149803 Transcript_77524/m.149803 type:complete len:268 (-) Transcript_77524:44-847(-)
MPATWATMRRADGGLEIKSSRMKGALNQDYELNHYGGRVEDGGQRSLLAPVEDGEQLAPGGNQLAKQMGLFAIGAGVGMAIHVATHHIHKDDELKGGSASVGENYAGKADGSHFHAQFVNARATAGAGKLGVQALASAHVAHVRAQACGGIPGAGNLGAPVFEATGVGADSNATASVLGAQAGARASGARASVGLEGTPATLGLDLAGAGAAAGLHLAHMGAYAGFHLAEAHAGPFAGRFGLKYGGGIENGIPVIHAGPVSAPCTVM